MTVLPEAAATRVAAFRSVRHAVDADLAALIVIFIIMFIGGSL